jgi:hypothetical protein
LHEAELVTAALDAATEYVAIEREHRIDVAAAWSMVHGIADLALSGRMKFMDEPGLGADPDATYRNLIERILPRMK